MDKKLDNLNSPFSTVYEDSVTNPVHFLFLAVLQTAVEDIQYGADKDREQAFQFFISNKSWLPYGISYLDVVTHYTLKQKYTAKINELLDFYVKDPSIQKVKEKLQFRRRVTCCY